MEIKEEARIRLEEKGFVETKPDLYLRDSRGKSEFIDLRNDKVSFYAYDEDEQVKVDKDTKRLVREIKRLSDEAQETLI